MDGVCTVERTRKKLQSNGSTDLWPPLLVKQSQLLVQTQC